MGRGISSSSALCVAILKVLNNCFGTQYSDKHIAILAQKVERNYIGVSGGLWIKWFLP
jgi:galactokinase